jgi:hypothetical protein
MLTGVTKHIRVSGRLGNEKNTVLKDENGDIECTGDYTSFSCKIEYKDMVVDQAKAFEAILEESTSFEEAIGRIQVMRAFSSDPVGIVRY